MDNDDHEGSQNNIAVSDIVEQSEGQKLDNDETIDTPTSVPVADNQPDMDKSVVPMVDRSIDQTTELHIEVTKDNDDNMENIVRVNDADGPLPATESDVSTGCESFTSIQPTHLDGEEKLPIHVDVDESRTNDKVQNPVSSLSIIASAYDDSDSDSEQCNNAVTKEKVGDVSDLMEIQITKEYRNVPDAMDDDSSDSDDSSSSVSTVSLSDAESDDGDRADDNSDGSVDIAKTSGNKKKMNTDDGRKKESKGEYDDLPPIEELKISVPEVLCDPLGEVAWMVEQMVVVRPKPGKPTLNLDTVLFIDRGRRPLGRIFDVFGQVSDPHYCVRFNSSKHIEQSEIKVGMTVYFCPNTEYTSVVFLQDLLKMKATDELGDDEHPEFSDDEEERAYYAALKQKQKSERTKTVEAVPQKRQRTDPSWKSNHPWSGGRKHDKTNKPDRSYNSPVPTGGTQQNPRNSSNLWQQQHHHHRQPYPQAYPNILWPSGYESYQGNGWPTASPSPNPYGYTENFANNHPQPNNPRPFRPPRCFQPGPYPQQPSNPHGHPPMNFPCQSPILRQPVMAWRFPPPPPPPPPPGM